MNTLDRQLDRVAQPGVVLRIAVLAVCLLELTATAASLLGYRSDAYDGAVAALYLRLGGASNDPVLLLGCFALVLLFAWSYWRLAVIGSADQPPRHALTRLILIDVLAICVTPGLPFLVTALAAVVLPSRAAFLFGLAQIGVSLLLNALLPLAEPVAASGPSAIPAWLDGLGLVMAMVALHGMAFGLGRMAAAEAEKRRWLQVMLAERMSAEQLQAEQLRYSERTLMARELHDVVGHHLTALNLQLQLGSALLHRGKTEGAGQAVEKARECAAQLLADVREAVSQQRGSQRIDLSAALQALAEGIALIRIELDIAPAARDLSPRVAHALLRCVQEAVTNSVRHAQAARVRITLCVDDAQAGEDALSQQIRVSIDDDGKGAPRLNPGNGLQGMAERMAELGGSMQVLRNQPGFKIELCCPRTV
ncbi:sensor histidine kinase [Paucibacter sp. Y2R2-4]|uniref:sensor histidine kinase n=1 Tax=Paucibacter sp. Y2R2-4 TaxID=2893553 RepID=UPI0021E4888E|nr:histidine kinase [Paucibacter sp. Y2R2-4]MCV2351403.1 histidine kinase [Paucibacter sp. Y2R2-4]